MTVIELVIYEIHAGSRTPFETARAKVIAALSQVPGFIKAEHHPQVGHPKRWADQVYWRDHDSAQAGSAAYRRCPDSATMMSHVDQVFYSGIFQEKNTA